jgi:hypothetical protein
MIDRVTVLPLAVGGDLRKVILHRVSHDSGSSTVVGPTGGPNDLDVEQTTLDNWAADNDWPSIDLVKMDIEGAEAEALAGMKGMVRRNPDLTLIVECQKPALELGGMSAMRLFDRLNELGFDAVEVLDDRRPAYRLTDAASVARALRRSAWYPLNLRCSRKPEL